MNVQSIAEVQNAVQNGVQGGRSLLPRGAGTKTALSRVDGATILEMRGLSGILEYQPGEYTFTALAGTPIAEIEAALAEHGQYMPFDPPQSSHGATLGGTVAAGVSGSGRYRYGGVRDFLIGVRFVDGRGQLVRGGGKVVKNAAGFDLPKLMVGSLGRLGVLVDLSFKVFPRPTSYSSLRVSYPSVAEAVTAIQKLAAAPFDLDALDLTANPNECHLWVRQGGLAEVSAQRLAHLHAYLVGDSQRETTTLDGEEEALVWQNASDLAWVPSEWVLAKVPTTPGQVCGLDARLADANAMRRYCVGGNLTWIAWPHAVAELDRLLLDLRLSGLVLRGPSAQPRIGVQKGEALLDRIKEALDAEGRLGPV